MSAEGVPIFLPPEAINAIVAEAAEIVLARLGVELGKGGPEWLSGVGSRRVPLGFADARSAADGERLARLLARGRRMPHRYCQARPGRPYLAEHRKGS